MSGAIGKIGAIALVLVSAPVAAQHTPGAMSHAAGAIMYHGAAWSPDGKWILSSANLDGDTEIYLVRADGGTLQQLTRNTVPDDMARWSEDGRRVLFDSHREGQHAQYSMNPDGSDLRVLARDSVISRSADGKTLLFESVREGRGRLFTMASDRTNPREIAAGPHAEQGSFSPDGQWIVLEQRDAMHDKIPFSQIVVARPDGREPRVIATGTDPAWSRDGSVILFKTWDEPSQSLWISTVSPTGTGLVRLAKGVHPSWSPDGTRIAFMQDRADGGADIWVMNRDGNEARCVTCRAPFR